MKRLSTAQAKHLELLRPIETMPRPLAMRITVKGKYIGTINALARRGLVTKPTFDHFSLREPVYYLTAAGLRHLKENKPCTKT